MARRTSQKTEADEIALFDLRVGQGKRKRRLNRKEFNMMIQFMAIKKGQTAVDPMRLAPDGSFLARNLRHFHKTDIPHALPTMEVVMLAASWLTQQDAILSVPGVGELHPTLWTIGLAPSGSSKTLAAQEVMAIIGGSNAKPIAFLPAAATDAQWIVDLSENNGSYWHQDEVGKFVRNVLTQPSLYRMKPWMLDAYSHAAIGNRLKSEDRKLVIDKPMFTFHGLTVVDTWKMDIDLTSMLDGFCQRFNFFIAEERQDTDMFDHFLYFAGEKTERRRQLLRRDWEALCAQPGATSTYTLNPYVLPYLEDWWKGLRESWGRTPLPASFIRRIGFSILKYLMVLQFLLGKSKLPIDVETAQLATTYAEFHFESALAVIQDYHSTGSGCVQKIVALRDQLLAAGKAASKREIARRLSKAQRAQIPGELIEDILAVLNQVEAKSGIFEADAPAKVKSAALIGHRDEIEERLRRNERKRNERRLRNLRKAYADAEANASTTMASSTSSNVVDFDDCGGRAA